MLERGGAVFYALAGALIGVVLVTLRRLPSSVASHFDAAGRPNGWYLREITGICRSMARKRFAVYERTCGGSGASWRERHSCSICWSWTPTSTSRHA
jgi:hypothetical protein